MLVVLDLFLKAAIFVPLKKLPTAPQTEHLSLQYVFHGRGLPEHVVTGRGAQFTAWFWKGFMDLFGCNSILSPYFTWSQMLRWSRWTRCCSSISSFTFIRMIGCFCYRWQNLPIKVAPTLPQSRPFFTHSVVFIPVAIQLLCQLSRGFPLRIPLSS